MIMMWWVFFDFLCLVDVCLDQPQWLLYISQRANQQQGSNWMFWRHILPPSTFAAKNFIDMQKPFKDYPEMRYLKAANIRYLVPLACQLCREYGAKDALGKNQLAAMVGLMACYDLLHTERKVLTKTMVEAMKLYGLQFLLNYCACAKLCEDSPDNRYSVVPKFHYFFHLLEQAVDVNPHYLVLWWGRLGWKGLFFSSQLHQGHCQSQGWIFYDGQVQGGHAPEMVMLLKIWWQQKMSWWKNVALALRAFSFVVWVHGIFQPALASFS